MPLLLLAPVVAPVLARSLALALALALIALALALALALVALALALALVALALALALIALALALALVALALALALVALALAEYSLSALRALSRAWRGQGLRPLLSPCHARRRPLGLYLRRSRLESRPPSSSTCQRQERKKLDRAVLAECQLLRWPQWPFW